MRSTNHSESDASMNIKVAAILSVVLCSWLTACGSGLANPGPVVGKVYVVAPTGRASSFTEELATFTEKYGMTASLGKATDDKGRSLYVLDAAGAGVRLRSENVLLSGQENPDLCGAYTEPHRDPGQYFISVSPETQAANPSMAQEMLAQITGDLKVAGYDVRPEPLSCSALSKLESVRDDAHQ
jgi:hypothetical protein